MKRILLSFLGPPGSGKGTQAELLARDHGFQHIVTGDLIRAQKKNIRRNAWARGVIERMEKGIPQPDDVATKLVMDALKHPVTKPGVIFDPYPLSIGQAKVLEIFYASYESHYHPPYLIYFALNETESMKRLLLRHQTQGRSDDTEEIIRFRYREYTARANELRSFYEERGRFIEIDGEPPIPEVYRELLRKLEEYALIPK